MPTPGDRIKALREEHGWTQETLAERAQMSKGFLSDLENNKRNVSANYALRIADALGVSLDYLLRGERNKTDLERKPVEIPPELSAAAQELNLSYNETLVLLDTYNAVVARRSHRSMGKPTVDEWKKLHKAIKDVYPDGAKTGR